jgi:hypothetical protein
MFDNIIFKKCWQRHDIRYSKDVISRDVTKTSIDFFKKLINAILLVSYDAKSLFFYQSHLVKTTTVFYPKKDILSDAYRKPALLTCFFHHFHAISIICSPSCEFLLHNAEGIDLHNIFERLVPNGYEYCTNGIWSWVCM